MDSGEKKFTPSRRTSGKETRYPSNGKLGGTYSLAKRYGVKFSTGKGTLVASETSVSSLVLPQSTIQYVLKFAVGKPLGCELALSLPSIVKVKNKWSYNFAPPVCLHVLGRGDFIFCTLTLPASNVFVFEITSFPQLFSPQHNTSLTSLLCVLHSQPISSFL